MIIFDETRNVFSSSKINTDRYISGFGTKFSGDAKNPDTIVDFFKRNNITFDSIVIQNQSHSVHVTVIDESEKLIQQIENSDGLVTRKNNIILIVKTADCVPIIYTDIQSGIIGISHQGWKGTLDNLPVKMIETMVAIGSKKEDISVVIGPSIGSCCYHIEAERYEMFHMKYPTLYNEIVEFREEKIFLNILKANYLMLLNAGVSKENIDYKISCTQCDSANFFSRRRDGEFFGNMFSFVMKV